MWSRRVTATGSCAIRSPLFFKLPVQATMSDALRQRKHSTNNKHDPSPPSHDQKQSTHSRSSSFLGSLFHSHSHSHSHDHGHGHGHDSGGAQQLLDALRGGKNDPGSRITLIGLYSNVGLALGKGAAAWALNSASLMADAVHSASDLLGDVVTLICWRWSRRPPSQKYPYGFGKFETLGTTTISLILMGGALGIGFHSYYLLLHALEPQIASMSPGIAQDLLAGLASSNLTETLAHMHHDDHSLDPNAAWFALIGIGAKEYLYRITKRVADSEKSHVLAANALHHRSDAYTSLVALLAILGTWLAPWLPLDPIGGILVSFVILQQSVSVLFQALRELMDAGASESTITSLNKALIPLISVPSSDSRRLLQVSSLRARRSGTNMFVDLCAHVPSDLTIHDASEIEESIRSALVEARSEIKEVHIKFVTVASNGKASER